MRYQHRTGSSRPRASFTHTHTLRRWALASVAVAIGLSAQANADDSPSFGLSVRSAQAPVVVDHPAPRGERLEDFLGDDAETFLRDLTLRVSEAVNAHPGRVVALRLIEHPSEPSADEVRHAVLEHVLYDVQSRYDSALLSIWDFPASAAMSGWSLEQLSEGERRLVGRLDAFVSQRSFIMHNGGLSEGQVIRRSFGELLSISDGRPLLVRTNGDWRMVQVQDADGDVVKDPANELRSGPRWSSTRYSTHRPSSSGSSPRTRPDESQTTGVSGSGGSASGFGVFGGGGGARGGAAMAHGRRGGSGGAAVGGGKKASGGSASSEFSDGEDDAFDSPPQGSSGSSSGSSGGSGGSGGSTENSTYVPFTPKAGQHGLLIRCGGSPKTPENPLRVATQLRVNPKAFFKKHVARAKELHAITGNARVVFHMINGWDDDGMRTSGAVLGAMPDDRKVEFIKAVNELTAEGIAVGVYFTARMTQSSTSVYIKDAAPVQLFKFSNPAHFDMKVNQVIKPLLDIGVTEFWLDSGSASGHRYEVALLAEHIRQLGGYVVMEAFPRLGKGYAPLDMAVLDNMAAVALNRYIYFHNDKKNDLWMPLPTNTELVAVISGHQTIDNSVPSDHTEKMAYLAAQTKKRLSEGFTVFNMTEPLDDEFLKIIADWTKAQQQ